LSLRKAIGHVALVLTFAALAAPPAARGEEPDNRGLLRLAGYHVKWGDLAYGRRAELTYAFLRQAHRFPGSRNCVDMVSVEALQQGSNIEPEAFEREIAAAFELWSGAADLRFSRTDDMAQADIIIGAQASSVGVAFTNVVQNAGPNGPIDGIGQATICFDPSERWEVGMDGDPRTYNLRYVATHEIGHAIGLDHRGRDRGIMGFAYQEKVASPDDIRLAATDIAAAARLYGPAEGVRGIATMARARSLPSTDSCSPGGTGPAVPVIACGLAASPD
jgi:hypothetical protein